MEFSYKEYPLFKIKITYENNISYRLEYYKEDVSNLNETEFSKKVFSELNEYFEGKRRTFDIKLSPQGTDFQNSVWNELLKIPYGETEYYSQIAEKIGKPKAQRAVGMANNKNPIAIIIPCHRVIGKNGNLTGYAGGLEIKKYLLGLEKNHI